MTGLIAFLKGLLAPAPAPVPIRVREDHPPRDPRS